MGFSPSNPDPRLERLKWVLPKAGDFIVFTGNFASWRLIRKVYARFKRHVRFKALWLPAPNGMTGPDMSDQWSFWREGYPAMMVTDTAFLRYPFYHDVEDLPRNMNFPCMTRVVHGVLEAAQDIAGRC